MHDNLMQTHSQPFVKLAKVSTGIDEHAKRPDRRSNRG
jgi:hypothetical protein